MLRAGFGCLLGIAVTGCAVVEETHQDGTATRSVVLATPVFIHPDLSDRNSIVKVTGLGIVASNDSATVGLFSESRININRECRVILIGNTEQQLRNFAQLLPKGGGLCIE
jgi:hypothetical protein